jgi:hypothetical protein
MRTPSKGRFMLLLLRVLALPYLISIASIPAICRFAFAIRDENTLRLARNRH